MVSFIKTVLYQVINMAEFDRTAAGLLSGFAGIARSHLVMIESGTKQPNFETLWRIANALQIPPHSLVALIEEEAKNGTTP